ncbi:MAG: twin-arginine translocation signal domain-containing protein [Thiotrichales bacterium]|nr:twin-arginine translocation signal domain-containing protein [Thiotrichales bacterium]
MSELPISRRSFLKSSGAVLVGTLAVTTGPISLLAPSKTWALELNDLSEHEGATLLRFSRHLYPHDTLEDAVYALVVKDLDAAAAADSATAKLLTDGVSKLDELAGDNWLDLDENKQFEHVKSLEDTPFFQKVRSTTVVTLYNNDMAFAHFGYPGSKGDTGYLHRGFNDLNWLTDPPDAASGPLPIPST